MRRMPSIRRYSDLCPLNCIWAPPQISPAAIRARTQGMTSSSAAERPVVASKPSNRRALLTSGIRRRTSCGYGASEAIRGSSSRTFRQIKAN